MEEFFLALSASVLAALAAALVGRWVDQRLAPPVQNFVSADIKIVPHGLTLKIGAVAVVAAWASILILLALGIWALIVERALGSPIPGEINTLIVLSLGAFVAFMTVYGIAAYLVRCARCNRRVLAQALGQTPFSERFGGLTGWGAVVLSVLARGTFRCLYCGQRYLTVRTRLIARESR
jgi:hypothetical protein